MLPTARITHRRLPEPVRRRVEVAAAMAWQAIVETHADQAGRFIRLLGGTLALEEALGRYLLEMDLTESVATAVRTRVLVAIEAEIDEGDSEPEADEAELAAERRDEAEPSADGGGWRRFRPDRVVENVRRRQRRLDEIESWISLALARAEEAVIRTHVDNAIAFAALLDEQLALDGAVQHYISAVGLSGGRAQAVHQRTMARLADIHLPPAGRRKAGEPGEPGAGR